MGRCDFQKIIRLVLFFCLMGKFVPGYSYCFLVEKESIKNNAEALIHALTFCATQYNDDDSQIKLANNYLKGINGVDKNEMQALALKHLKWEQEIPQKWAEEDARKKAEEEAQKKAAEEAEKKAQEEAKLAKYKENLQKDVAKKKKDHDLRNTMAEKLKQTRRKKGNLFQRLGLVKSGREKAMDAAKKFHEENPTQKTALRFGAPKKSGRG